MPYIRNADRKKFDEILYKLPLINSPGTLNYALTILCKQYLLENGETYQSYNDIVGALEGCKLELYRIKIASYEEKKKLENGGVY